MFSSPYFTLQFKGAAIVSFQMSSTHSNYSKCEWYHLHVNCLFIYPMSVFNLTPTLHFVFVFCLLACVSVGPTDRLCCFLFLVLVKKVIMHCNMIALDWVIRWGLWVQRTTLFLGRWGNVHLKINQTLCVHPSAGAAMTAVESRSDYFLVTVLTGDYQQKVCL